MCLEVSREVVRTCLILVLSRRSRAVDTEEENASESAKHMELIGSKNGWSKVQYWVSNWQKHLQDAGTCCFDFQV